MSNNLPVDYVKNKLSKEYPTEIGSQFFKPDDIEGFKEITVNKVKDHYKYRLSELEEEYKNLMDEIDTNSRIYSSTYNFEPVVGKVYHLYKGINGEFLSLISPEEWGFEYIGSYKYLYDGRWWGEINK